MKRNLAIRRAGAVALATLITVTPVQAATDIGGHWAENVLTQWANEGLISGFPDGTLRPDETVTRAQFVTMMQSAFNFTNSNTPSFVDISVNDWYYNAIGAAVGAGVTNGFPDGTFAPDQAVTRAQAAVFATNLIGVAGGSVANYTDSDNIPEWAKASVATVTEQGYMSALPDGSFSSDTYLTRAQAVAFLDNIRQNMSGGESNNNNNVVKEDKVINQGNIHLRDQVFESDLIIDSVVGSGNVMLEDLVIEGDLIIRGGNGMSIYIDDSKIKGEIIVEKDGVGIDLSGNTTVGNIDVTSPCTLTSHSFTGNVDSITISENLGLDEDVVINIKTDIINLDALASLKITTSNEEILASEYADGSLITLDSGVVVDKITANSAIDIQGEGVVKNLIANASGIVIGIYIEAEEIETSTNVKEPTKETVSYATISSGNNYGSNSGSSSGSSNNGSSGTVNNFVSLTGSSKLTLGSSSTVTADINDLTAGGTLVWAVEYSDGTDYPVENIEISGNSITITANSNLQVGNTIDVIAEYTVNNTTYTTSQNLTVVSAYSNVAVVSSVSELSQSISDENIDTVILDANNFNINPTIKVLKVSPKASDFTLNTNGVDLSEFEIIVNSNGEVKVVDEPVYIEIDEAQGIALSIEEEEVSETFTIGKVTLENGSKIHLDVDAKEVSVNTSMWGSVNEVVLNSGDIEEFKVEKGTVKNVVVNKASCVYSEGTLVEEAGGSINTVTTNMPIQVVGNGTNVIVPYGAGDVVISASDSGTALSVDASGANGDVTLSVGRDGAKFSKVTLGSNNNLIIDSKSSNTVVDEIIAPSGSTVTSSNGRVGVLKATGSMTANTRIEKNLSIYSSKLNDISIKLGEYATIPSVILGNNVGTFTIDTLEGGVVNSIIVDNNVTTDIKVIVPNAMVDILADYLEVDVTASNTALKKITVSSTSGSATVLPTYQYDKPVIQMASSKTDFAFGEYEATTFTISNFANYSNMQDATIYYCVNGSSDWSEYPNTNGGEVYTGEADEDGFTGVVVDLPVSGEVVIEAVVIYDGDTLSNPPKNSDMAKITLNISEADFSGLETLIGIAENLEPDNYTVESWNLMIESFNNFEASKDSFKNQDEIDYTVNIIAEAITNLQLVAEDNQGEDLEDNQGEDLEDNQGEDLEDNQSEDLEDNQSEDLEDNQGEDLEDNQSEDLEDNQNEDLEDNQSEDLEDNQVEKFVTIQNDDNTETIVELVELTELTEDEKYQLVVAIAEFNGEVVEDDSEDMVEAQPTKFKYVITNSMTITFEEFMSMNSKLVELDGADLNIDVEPQNDNEQHYIHLMGYNEDGMTGMYVMALDYNDVIVA